MKHWKVVVTDWEYEDLRYEERVLHRHNIQLVPAQCRTEEEVITACRDADALINQYAPVGRRVIEALERCRVIARYGVGVNTVDLNAATEKGICVTNVPDYCLDEVSDHALALLLTWARKVTVANLRVKSGVWDYKETRPIFRLRGRILGLVGFGKIPQTLAEKAIALGLEVVAYDPYISEETVREKGVRLCSLEEICRRSDFLSVHAPLTADTRGMIGTEQFLLMKKEAVLINTSRGPLVDEAALIQALREERIAGAALDVAETEPLPPDHPFTEMEQVILTPHVAWYSQEAEEEMRTKAAEGVLDVLLGQIPRYLVNDRVIEALSLRPRSSESIKGASP